MAPVALRTLFLHLHVSPRRRRHEDSSDDHHDHTNAHFRRRQASDALRPLNGAEPPA